MSQQPILISLFNHKGGVSKTTTTFNLGWTFANKGIKTLIVDADPQCNLTAYVLQLQKKQSIDEFYKDVDNDNLHSKLHPIVTGKTLDIQAVRPADTLNDNLKLVAGHLSMSDFDIQVTAGLLSAEGGFLQFTAQFVGALNTVVRKTAEQNQCQLVLIDMSPSSGAMNRSILMSSDYFIVPTSPDFFSYQAIQNLGDMFVSWNESFKKFRDPTLPNALPLDPPKMLGVVSQKYRPYTLRKKELTEHIPLIGEKKYEERKKGIAKSFKEWIDKIQRASNDQLAEKLKDHRMVIDKKSFIQHITDEKPYNLISIGDFNSLIAQSQKYGKPVFELTEEEIAQTGKSLQEMKENQKLFKESVNKLAERIGCLIEDDYSGNKQLNLLNKQ